ncbi:MAG: RHS repeat protein [Arenicella sp.]|nr:RHS repeat protein [Arenicella sp.]
MFDYSVSSNEAFNIVKITGPNSIEEYRHHKPPVRVRIGLPSSGTLNLWRAGLLDTKTIRDLSNRLIQIEAYQYDKRQLSSEPYERFPYAYSLIFNNDPKTYQHYLTERKITRDGTDFITRYENFADNINPHRIVEIGQQTKTTTLTYYPRSDGQNIVSQVATQSVGSGTNRKISRTFDSRGNTTAENRYGVLTKYSYDSKGNVTRVEDARGNQTDYSQYKLGVPRAESHPEGVAISRSVDNFGNVTTVQDGRNNATNYQYDDINRLTSIDPPRGATTNISWSTSRRTVNRGRYNQVTDIDGFGRTICTQTAGVYIGLAYDALGNRTYETYPSYSNCNSSARTRFTYDALNRTLKTTHTDNTSQTISYLSANRQSLRDERNKIFVSTYRSFGNPDSQELMSVTGPESLNYNVERNILGQVTKITRDGIVRNYNFGSSIFMLNETHPETGRTVYGRDVNGNRTSKKVGASGTTFYTYDRLNRLTNTNYPGSTPDTVRFYDQNSNVTRISSGISNLAYRYDQNNSIETESQTIEGKTYNINYAYDDSDFVASTTNPDNSVINYSPNALGWPTKAAPFVTAVTYNASGQPLSIGYQNGRTTTHSYQPRLWPNVTAVNGGVSSRTRNYDASGNLLTLRDNLSSRLSRTMTYDGLNRIRSANGPWGTSSVTYGLADDIATKRMGTGSNLTYNYNTNNRKISSISGLQGISGSATFSYDVYGNISRKSNSSGGWSYTYDDASNLREIKDTANNTLRQYDYSGLRQRVRSIKPDETRLHVVNQQGQIVGEFVTIGDKPNITNVYLGNRLIAELELIDNNNPETVTGPGFGGGDVGTTVTKRFTLDKLIESLEYCVDGYAINASNEVLVQINGTTVGFLRAGGNGTKTCFNVPTQILRLGVNTVVFSQQGGDGVWGIGVVAENIKNFFNPASVIPTIMLLLDDQATQNPQ